jgi:hypothetical protein
MIIPDLGNPTKSPIDTAGKQRVFCRRKTLISDPFHRPGPAWCFWFRQPDRTPMVNTIAGKNL